MDDKRAGRLNGEQMDPNKISCKEYGWKPILERNLAEGREVDLVSFMGDYDGGYCQGLARKYSMMFEWVNGNDYAFFKKANSA